ncbi:MAG: hypothetical protein LBV69_10690 [Bacteroidales bacterium]|nr:hypothetical protein [Bacteroidales bacterium]
MLIHLLVEICKKSRAKRSEICSTDEIKPSFGYYAATKTHSFATNFHADCDENAVIHSFDFTPANVHDVNYLKDVKYILPNCELVGNKGYLSADS